MRVGGKEAVETLACEQFPCDCRISCRASDTTAPMLAIMRSTIKATRATIAIALIFVIAAASESIGQHKLWPFIPEDCTVRVRDPSALCHARIPLTPPPSTVYDEEIPGEPRLISLDEAIRIALDNATVIRVLTGIAASSSGSTIYDPSISATSIEEAKARFDPTTQVLNSWNRGERPPQPSFVDPLDPLLDPTRSFIGPGSRTDNYNLGFDLSKTTITGGSASFGVNASPTRVRPGIFPLNPSSQSSAELSYTQPLLQGGGVAVNRVPIVLARIDTERSYFRMKDSVQGLVGGVIQAYWALVQARVDLWAREQQLEQAEFAFNLAEARLESGAANQSEFAQTDLALENFQVSLLSARANLLLRETALRNILGLPPNDGLLFVPTTPPTVDEIRPDWESILVLAEERRPDLIELKLILEADQQLLLQANNQAQSRVDAVGLYRWNGLEGEMPIGDRISTRPGEFTDWTLGVNFSVPLGLRQSRAGLRRRELLITRDRANLDQGMHQVVHGLTINVRNLAQFYRQYERLQRARAAAKRNLDQQLADYRAGRVIFLNVLQAITDWGNLVSSEAQSLIQYNNELASLEQATGTILETHGVRFYEERFCSIGPLGRHHNGRTYPMSHSPGPNAARYPMGDGPAEEAFDLAAPGRDDEESASEAGAYQFPPVPERDLGEAAPSPGARKGFASRLVQRIKDLGK